ncbi:ATP-dependent DNA helicase RecG [Methylococcus capsulatus str. Bath]|jgi:ATP-dependent DNA helicase RecG|uniref:ATP-dependent DNA helicase RecG n=1 Tax=Methylococcus capsulatus (strain ATCC 33009 / NCIMB 11132 / Bath) TaxID=243233 RepID=Q606J1_METCA|nr:ATP-dependent DNA helicase RecG [Methylococcus capsulatus]AAU91730.1 ATP-dependent DNA helicase RecG [Methylococcus capsulatus str. Bath]
MATSRRPDGVSLDNLQGAGTKTLSRLNKLGIFKLQDLLLHLPIRYEDRTRLTPLGALQPGQPALVEGGVAFTDVAGTSRRSLICRISDGTGFLDLRFFHFRPEQLRALSSLRRIRCFGEVRVGVHGLEMIHPQYEALPETAPAPLETGLTPVYPTTDGLSQQSLRRFVAQALRLAEPEHEKSFRLPPRLAPELDALSWWDAVRTLHRPMDDCPKALERARRRLAYEELLAHHLSLARFRQEIRRRSAPVLNTDEAIKTTFQSGLPFSLTGAQRRVIGEIESDLRSGRPMLRLLQGDVGSGKTIVAAHAALAAASSGWQTALMAPTELLAEQHFHTFSGWLESSGVTTTLLTGKIKGQGRREALAAIASGATALVIGTHALFQDAVEFHRLGLTIIDEQHRFGVHQRLALRDKAHPLAALPHQLVMTATPIPRTLAILGYADLDCSVLDELPPGRTPVVTRLIPSTRRGEIIDRIANWIARGRQAYWVCTLIDESEALQCEAAANTAASLAQTLPGLRIRLLHGRMSAAEKDGVMREFKAGESDILVATTVIEVGVDVPNAGLMIIENPERLGLAQLHQLRGRVGRGPGDAYCILLYQPPLSAIGRERLKILKDSSDGFAIAERDLRLRGPGEFLGVRQTGLARFRIADLTRDADLIETVSASAERVLEHHPELVAPLIDRWVGRGVHYAGA